MPFFNGVPSPFLPYCFINSCCIAPVAGLPISSFQPVPSNVNLILLTVAVFPAFNSGKFESSAGSSSPSAGAGVAPPFAC